MSEDRKLAARNVAPTPEELGFDPVATRDKYAVERAKRMRDDGNEQYLEVTGEFERYNDADPYFGEAPVRSQFDQFSSCGGETPKTRDGCRAV